MFLAFANPASQQHPQPAPHLRYLSSGLNHGGLTCHLPTMSGIELIGAISGIVAILDTAVKAYEAIKDASGLPSTFHSVAERIPLVLETLQIARDGISLHPGRENSEEGDSSSIIRVLNSCEKKALKLQTMFRLMAPKPGGSTPRRFTTALQALGKGKKVEGLMEGIIADIQLLVGSQVLSAQTREKVRGFEERVQVGGEKSRVQGHEPAVGRSKERWRRSVSISNSGGGSQHVHTGVGDQYINTSEAPQYHGTFTGPFTFSFSAAGTPSPSPPVTPRSTVYADRRRYQRESPPPWSP
ncbi:hypothetical protein B0T14DRAFT_518465 [Immersiella caudata]|uniref:NACHT-NTPase and P-loop NTPases N-terminal domain-containing protein n=1 Tax=Immersiella caudata TaxID=314043 RepID=A0AA40BZE2_9PEZI|nr:hypothetical protein B0T14DRAFT_518465 [Immersiella caudata]